MIEVCFSNTEEQPGESVLFKNRGTSVLEVCYLKTEEQQRWKCVIPIQTNINDGIVLFKYRGKSMMKVCYSNTEEHQ